MSAEDLINGLGLTLLHFLWQGALIAVLFYGFSAFIPAAASRQRYCVGCVALLAMAIAPVITLNRVAVPTPTLADSIMGLENPVLKSEQSASVLKTDQPVVVAAHFKRPSLTLKERLQHCLPLVVLLWILGIVALGARWFAGWRQIQRLRCTGLSQLDGAWPERLKTFSSRLRLSRPVCLAQSAWAEVPLVIGWLRPMILLPASCVSGLAPEQLESILAHELAHVARHDYLINLLQCALETLLFYHPAVWAVSRRVRWERENCCDDLAVELCGNKIVYARALATLEEMRSVPVPLVLAANDAPLLARIRRLLGQPHQFRASPVWPLIMFAGLICITLFLLPVSKGKAVNVIIPLPTNSVVALEEPRNDPMRNYSTNTHAILIELKAFAVKEELFQLVSNGLPSSAFGVSGLLTASQAANAIKLMRKSPGVSESPALTGLAIRAEPLRFRLVSFPPGLDSAPKQSSGEAGNTLVYVSPKVDSSGLIDLSLQATVFPAISNQPTANFQAQVTLSNGMTTMLEVKLTNQPDMVFFASVTITNNIAQTRRSDASGFETRTFHFDTNAFRALLDKQTDTNTPITERVRDYFAIIGVDMNTNNPVNLGKMFAFNSKKGVLLVRLPPDDLKRVEDSIAGMNQPPINSNEPAFLWVLSPGFQEGMNQSPINSNEPSPKTNPVKKNLTRENFENRGLASKPALNPKNLPPTNSSLASGPGQVDVKVHFVEVDETKNNKFNWQTFFSTNAVLLTQQTVPPSLEGATNATMNFNPTTNAVTVQFTGILSAAKLKLIQSELRQMDGIEELAAPQVTTESGRQAQMQMVEIKTVFTSVNSIRDEQGQVHYDYQTQNLPFGTVLDVIPTILTNSSHVQLKLEGTSTEFLGYSEKGDLQKEFTDGRGAILPKDLKAAVPHPQYYVCKVGNNLTVDDGQSIVMIGVASDPAPVATTNDSAMAKIPWVGRLFRPPAIKPPRKIMMVFVTANIINPDGTLKYPANHLN